MKYYTKPSSSAKDVFSYLLMIIMLLIGVVSYIAMIWQYINVSFPDALNQAYGAYDIIRNSISSLVVVWPVLIGVSWMIGRDLKKDHDKQDIWVRKWLMYLTLFVASMTIIIDLIMLLNNFLDGEVTARFVLRVLVVLLVAGSIFAYELWDLKRDVSVKTQISRNVAIGTSVLILASIIFGFFLVGSPSTQRSIRLDNQRVSDLQNIQYQIINYWTQKETVPESLDALQDPISGFSMPLDPITNTPYLYQKKSATTFEICAVFDVDSSKDLTSEGIKQSYPMRSGSQDVWTHAPGKVCFDRTIDPDMYKAGYPQRVGEMIP